MKRVKIDGMLLSTFLTTLFYSATYPYIHKYIVSIIPDSFLAGQNIICCLSIIVFGHLWNKYPEALFSKFPMLCIVEFVSTAISAAVVLITNNVNAYFVLDTLFFALISRNIICGAIKLKARRYTAETDRTEFDNKDNSMCAIATIIGSLVAMVLSLDFHIMIILASVGNLIDNVFYITIYYSTKKAGEINE